MLKKHLQMLWMAAGLWPLTLALLAQESGPGTGTAKRVPDDVIKNLRSRYVAEDNQTAGLSETEKLRRYQLILREGAWTERQHPAAANLYQVREVMLAAARGVVFLSPSAEAEKELLTIAQRQVASSAPLQTRMFADLVVTRQQMAQYADEPARQLKLVNGFQERYTDPTLEVQALMLSLDLFDLINSSSENTSKNAAGGKGHAIGRLTEKYAYDPVVFAFLIDRGGNPFSWKPVKGRLQLADGSTLVLPRDVLGRVAVFNCWVTGRDGWSQNLAKWPTMTNSIKAMQGQEKVDRGSYSMATLEANGVEFYGLNADNDRTTWELGCKTLNLPWIQTYGDPSAGNPLGKIGQVRPPSVFMLTPDGIQFCDSHSDGSRGGGAVGSINSTDWNVDGNPMYVATLAGNFAAPAYEVTMRTRYYRAGEFLLDEVSVFPNTQSGPGDVPADKINVIREIVSRSPWRYYTPPADNLRWSSHVRLPTAVAEWEAKAKALRQVLSLGQALEKDYPRATNLTQVRNWMLVAARWLANERGDRDADRQSIQLAQAILAAKPPAGQGLFAEYVRLSDQLAKNNEKAVEQITAFAKPHAQTNVNWVADMFSYLLLAECGESRAEIDLVIEMLKRYPAPRPKLRGFMRDFCRMNVDANKHAYGMPWWMGQSDPRVRGSRLALADKPITTELPLLNGGSFRLPAAGSKQVALHFWTVSAPPRWKNIVNERPNLPPEVTPTKDWIIIGINLDEDRALVQEYLKQRPDLKDWIHVFSGSGWRDPLARELDLYAMPRSVILTPKGIIERWGYPGEPDRF